MQTSLITFCLVLAASPALADGINDLDIAKAHYNTGQDYFAAGRYEAAVKEFIEGHRLSKKPLLLFNIALCYEKLDDAGRVTAYYRQYLKERADAPERAEIERKLLVLAPRVATVSLTSPVAGAELYLDGELVGKAPVEPVLVTAGRHHFEARFADHAPTKIDAELPGGRSTTIALAPKIIAPVVETILVNAPAPAPAADPPRRRWLWPVVGAGAAVVIGVVVAVVLALTLHPTNFADNARGSCGMPNCTLIDLFGGSR